jgi:decaprenyl-phosphate phosphoribosyltransferase
MAVTAAAEPRPFARAALLALRPRQWTKNLLLFAGLLFAGKLGETSLWPDALIAFVAYCAASSAAYLANDVRDARHDRMTASQWHESFEAIKKEVGLSASHALTDQVSVVYHPAAPASSQPSPLL